MTNYISSELHGTQECDNVESHQKPMMPPTAPKLRAKAAPAEFQNFSMCQVEQVISSYGVGSS